MTLLWKHSFHKDYFDLAHTDPHMKMAPPTIIKQIH